MVFCNLFNCGDVLMVMKHSISTLAVWGDSILKGIIQGKNGKEYSLCRNNSLKNAAETLGLEIINHSYFGSTIEKGKEILRRDLSRNIKCDAAIIEFGGNDCDFNWADVSASPEKKHEPKTPLPAFISGLKEIIQTLRDRNIKPALMTLPPLVPERYFFTISRGLDPRNILNWLGDVHRLYRWHEMYSAAIARFALENNCFLIDMRMEFIAEHNYQRLICEDGIHPNEEGHRFMGSVFVKTGQNVIFDQTRAGYSTLSAL